MRWTRMVLVAAALSLLAATDDPLAVELPQLQEMPGMEATWAARKMAMNGVPMTIKTFTSPRSGHKVLAYYEREWRAAGMSTTRQAFGEYDTIGTGDGRNFYSVQVRDVGGLSEGRLTVSRRVSNPDSDTQFPLPRRTQMVSKIDSIDAGTRAESIVAYAPGGAVENADWFMRELRNEGWAVDPYVAESSAKEKVLAFQRNAELCQLTLMPDQPGQRGKTMLLIHWVKGS